MGHGRPIWPAHRPNVIGGHLKSVSSTRLCVMLTLLVALCAAASIQVAGLRAHRAQPRSAIRSGTASPTDTVTNQQSLSEGLWLSESGQNLGIAFAYGLNFVLILIVFLLLRRNGRYRQNLFAKAFRSSPLSITISTLSDGRYVDVNHAFLQMLGFERRDVIGRSSAELGIWVDSQDRSKMLQQLNDSSVNRGLYTKLRAKSGEIREANVTAEAIDVDGTPCVLAVTQDVTEARRLENQLRQAQRMGAIGRLAGGVAHDFNNILTVIVGYSELAAYRLGAGHGVSKHLSEIKLAAERAASLTRQLLAFSRQQVLYPRILDLNAVVTNLTQMLLRMIGEDIALSFKPGAVGSIRADLGQIEQILMNLVVNARDAMPQGGMIAIETSSVDLGEGYVDSHLSVRPGRYVLLSVSDTGCGMDEKTVSQVFEPFFTTKGPGQGTGLGLSTVYGIVKQSDGYIWVYSELGRGTTFKLYFPEHEQASQPAADLTPLLDIVIGAETVLVVEDDEALRNLITALLGSSGYKVLAAANGEEALRLVQENREQIDLLLTDMLMPAMTGVELAEQLRELQPQVKVLLMSGYAGDLIQRYRLSTTEIMLIEKPFTRHSLLSKIRAALQ
jgi:two-component system, cell cycle sensor histidine kinase and response regulator CckA